LGGGGQLAKGQERAVQRRGDTRVDWFGGPGIGAAMLSLSPATRIFVALDPIDMRQGFNGLYARVQTVLEEEPTSGHWFVFLNKRRNRLKILTCDGSGLWILSKRLERGTFAAPVGEGPRQCLRPEELTLLIHGLESTARRSWHRI
jgi:transposase